MVGGLIISICFSMTVGSFWFSGAVAFYKSATWDSTEPLFMRVATAAAWLAILAFHVARWTATQSNASRIAH